MQIEYQTIYANFTSTMHHPVDNAYNALKYCHDGENLDKCTLFHMHKKPLIAYCDIFI